MQANAPAATGITLDGLLDERARELSWEAWRRNLKSKHFESDYVVSFDGDKYFRVNPLLISENSLPYQADPIIM